MIELISLPCCCYRNNCKEVSNANKVQTILNKKLGKTTSPIAPNKIVTSNTGKANDVKRPKRSKLFKKVVAGARKMALRVINPAKMKAKIKRKASKILAKKAAKPILDA